MNRTLWASWLAVVAATRALDAQVAWVQRATSGPSAFDTAMCTDPSERGAVLFGGLGLLQPYPTETWVWDGTSWRQSAPIPSPPGRYFHGMAYDSWRRQAVLFGGRATATFFNDTWVWDGAGWTEKQPRTSPPPRWMFAMAFDAARGVVVVFGGTPDAVVYLNDTWVWNGITWTQRQPASSPSARITSAMAYDGARREIVLYGGFDTSGELGDTWTWDGVDWRERQPPTSPPPDSKHAMAYDTARERVVKYDGLGFETWEWDGTSWLHRSPLGMPTRWLGQLAYLPSRRSVLLYIRETWEYTPTNPADYSTFGGGCVGTAGVPSLAQASFPWLGDTLMLRVDNLAPQMAVVLNLGSSISAWGPLALPYPLAGIGMPGCWLLVSPDAHCAQPSTTGSATFRIPVPSDPSFVGRSFHNQALVLDPSANPLGLTTSNGGSGRIGSR
jgi:hypothetical protein